MTVLTTDCRDMLRACRANPDDDTARLVLADALDAHDEHDFAELIRVQVELSRLDCGSPNCDRHADQKGCDCDECQQFYANLRTALPMRDRARTLTTAHPDWLPPCPVCDGKEVLCRACQVGAHDHCGRQVPAANIRCNCEVCWGRGGPNNSCFCKGTGRVGTHVRGLTVLTVPRLATVFEYVSPGHNAGAGTGMRPIRGMWQLTDYARTLQKYPFASEVRCEDRVPGIWRVKPMYGWNVGDAHAPCRLPEFVFDRLAGWDHIGDGFKLWHVEGAAKRALACAVARAIYDDGSLG